MDNTNIQQFLDTLTEEQRAAVLACKTEEELEQVVDDYDIDLPDEMLAEVAGGKGILPFIMAGIMALSGGSAIVAGASEAPGQSADSGIAVTATYNENGTSAAEGQHKTITVNNPDGTVSFVRQTMKSGVWESDFSIVRSTVAAVVCFDSIVGETGEGITKRKVEIYGKRIKEIDENGNFVYGDEELLDRITATQNGNVNWTFGADIDLNSVRFRFRNESRVENREMVYRYLERFKNKILFQVNDGYIIPLRKNIYLKDLIGDINDSSEIETIKIGSGQYGSFCGGIKYTSDYPDLDEIVHPQFGYVTVEKKGILSYFHFLEKSAYVHNCFYTAPDGYINNLYLLFGDE